MSDACSDPGYNTLMFRIIVIALVLVNVLLLGLEASKPTVKLDTVAGDVAPASADIPTIHLLSEILGDQDLMSDNRRCFTLGPLHTGEDMNAVRAQLEAVAASINERQTKALVEKGYWVFMPPYASLLDANKALLSLQALGLNDSSVLYEGEYADAISLGYFLRQKNALMRKKSLQAKGYAVQMKVQRRDEPRYWLDYELLPGADLPTLDKQNYPNDLMQRAMPCPGNGPITDEPIADEPITEVQTGYTVTTSPVITDGASHVQSAVSQDTNEIMPAGDAAPEPEDSAGGQPASGVAPVPAEVGEDKPATEGLNSDAGSGEPGKGEQGSSDVGNDGNAEGADNLQENGGDNAGGSAGQG